FAASLVDLGEELTAVLAKSLAAHGYFLARYPSRYSSANNHAVAEALGLLAIGTALPHLPHATEWSRQGRTVLECDSRRQLLPDGVGAEQAVAYQRFTMEMLALAAELDADTKSRFPQAEAFLMAITDDGGNAPRIGDDDDAIVLWRPPSSPPSFPRRRESRNGRDSIERSHVGADAPHGLDSRLRGNDEVKIDHFPVGGYTAVREGSMLLVFDHGPLGYLSIAAHGHADALSIWLHVDGKPLLVDAGTYRYHGAGEARSRFRGTEAHNTLTVAGADQSEIAGPFNWSRKAECRVLSMTEAPWSVEAEHNGYRKRFGCLHRRRIETGGPLAFRVTDRLVGGGGPWPATAGFLVAPGTEIRYEDSIWRIGDRLRLKYSGPLKAEIRDADYSPSMGVIKPTLRLAFDGTMSNTDISRFDFSLAE
ncbi:MAG TPA: alginate lyase family protein, partial [Alphaproteobacteria bacterium]|nr:alginate lyase family protein [Alphaproteobacteria bacterium]